MLYIKKSPTANSSADYAGTTKNTLLESSARHIDDVVQAMGFFSGLITRAAGWHDRDKLTDIDWFLSDFQTGFEQTGWWDNHKKINRHHLNSPDGVPDDVNLVDVLEYISDCVMAGMARSGSVYQLEIDPEVLMKAFHNTAKLLQAQVVVTES